MASLRSGRVRAADGGFIGLRETERYLGNPASDGYILLANADGVRSWVDPTTVVSSINVLEETTSLGSFSDLKFLSPNLTAVGSGNTAEISLTDDPVFTTLEVSGDVSIADKIVHTGDTNTAIRFPANDTFTVETAGSERLRVTSNGSVGIGTTNPSETLDVNGNALVSGSVGIGTTNPSVKLDVEGDVRFPSLIYDSTGSAGVANYVIASGGPGTPWTWKLVTEAGAGQLDAIIVQNDGSNVGAGGTNSELHFWGNFDIIQAPSAGIASIRLADTLNIGGLNVSGVSTFQDDVIASSTLTVAGNVGIGTTLASQSLDVNGNARFRGAIYDNNNVVGGANSVLASTGSGVVWADITTIPVGDANTLDGLDSLQFLRSDVADTKVGVTTFEDDIRIINDGDKLSFGPSQQFELYWTSGSSIIKGNSIQLKNEAGSEDLLRAFQNGSVELYYDNSKKFETTATGIAVSNGASTSATIAGPDEIIIDPATVGDNTGSVRIKGDLFVDGTQTIINSSTIELADFIVGIASTATTDTLADGAGIQIGPDNTFLYEYNSGTNPSLKSSENLNVASGKVYQIDQTERLSANTLSLGTGTTIHSPASNILTFGTNGNERVRIDNVGDVTLNLSTTFNDEGVLKFGRADGVTRDHYIRVYNDSTPSNNYMKFQVHDGTSGSITPLTLFGDSKVGINTDSATQDLDVNGNARFRGAIYDNNNVVGAANSILTSTGSGVVWSDITTIPVGDANTLDGLDSTQFLRSDADDITTGQIQITKANSTSNGGGQLYLSGATGNRIDFNTNGIAAPSFTTRSVGTKIVLYPSLSGSQVDYALGIDSSTLWYSIPQATDSYQHRWYGGTTQLADLKGSGELVIGSASLTGTANQKLQVTGGAYVSGNLGVGVANPASNTQVAIAGTLGISEVGGSGARTLISSSGGGFNLNHNDNSNITIQSQGSNKLAYQLSNNSWSIPSGGTALLIGTGSTTGTASQPLQVSGGAYVSGNLGIGTDNPGYKLEVNGSFAATTKSFVIDHPTKEGMKLRYGSLEGPENGVYVRGRLNGNNTIELPDYWTGLVDEETITVNLTPIGRNASLHSVIDIVDNTVVVESASGEVNCFYTVFGERKDVEKLEVEF